MSLLELLPKGKIHILLIIVLISMSIKLVYDIFTIEKNISKKDNIKISNIFKDITRVSVICDDGIDENIEFLKPRTVRLKLVLDSYSKNKREQYILLIKPIISEE